jgi:hypothetical protein
MNFQSESFINKELYKLALDTRNLEIQLFWQRSNYFFVLSTAIGTGALITIKNISILALSLSIFGVIVSILWLRVNLGSRFWQNRWEHKTAHYERMTALGTTMDLLSASIDTARNDVREFLSASNPGFFKRIINTLTLKKPSVSMQMVYLSFWFCLLYLGLVIYSVLVLFFNVS